MTNGDELANSDETKEPGLRKWYYSRPFRAGFALVAVGMFGWAGHVLGIIGQYDDAAKARAGAAADAAVLEVLPQEQDIYRHGFVESLPADNSGMGPGENIADKIGASGALVTYYETASGDQTAIFLTMVTAGVGATVLAFRPTRRD